jgi:hypothetical protein
MPVEFAYAQARAQAQHGRRLSADTWSLLESSVGLSQFLHHVRGTALAPRVEHFSATTSPHAIERFLRREWHDDVESAAHWVPGRWRPAVAWTEKLAELPAAGHLLDGGEPQAWMTDDPVLSGFAAEDPASLPASLEAAGYGGGLDAWLRHWRGLWPDDSKGRDALEQLVSLADRLGIRRGENDAEDWRNSLERRAVSLLRRRRDEPVTVFCHLLLCALELHRLRQGLLRRALFNDHNRGEARA